MHHCGDIQQNMLKVKHLFNKGQGPILFRLSLKVSQKINKIALI